MSTSSITSWIRRGWDALFPIPNVGQLEAFLMRSMLAFTLYHFMPGAMDQVSQPVPVGLAHFFDLTWLADPAKYASFKFAFLFVAFWFASGVLLPVSLPVLTILHVLPYTLYNSQGHPHHGYQIMSLSLLGMSVAANVMAARGEGGMKDTLAKPVKLLVLLVAVAAAARIFHWWQVGDLRLKVIHVIGAPFGPAVQAWMLTWLGMVVFVLLCLLMKQMLNRFGEAARPTAAMNAWLLMTGQFVIAGAYLISVCSKMIRSKGEWLINSHYVALDFVKTMRQSYYSALDPRFARDPAGVVFLMEHENLARLFFDAGVVLETVLVFAVGTRRLAFIFGVCTVVMHISIQELMTLTFFTHEAMMSIFFINVPFIVAMVIEKFSNKSRLRIE